MTIKAFPVLETAKLVLRQPSKRDVRGLYRVSQDADVMRYYGMEPFQTEQQALDELNWFNQSFHDSTGLRWIIAETNQGGYIGDLGYHKLSAQHSRAEVGYRLARAYWRRGIMTEALSKVLEYGFNMMALNRVEALVDPRNEASFKLLLKLGFSREGVLREYEYEKGAFIDLLMMSLLRREWGL
jgi:ribosomal-protein-alanine N-acetyltransferase